MPLVEHLQLVLLALARGFFGASPQGTADDSQYLHRLQSLSRDEDPLILKGRVGRNHAIARRFHLQKIVGDQAFERIPVAELEKHPQPGTLRTCGEGSMLLPAFRGFEIPNETNGFRFRVRDLDEGALGSQEFQGVRLEPARGLDKTLQWSAVEAGD